MKILIIEDDKDIAELIAYNLKNERFSCEICGSAADGLRSISRSVSDLLVLDLMLPDMSGMNVCKRLKSDARTKDMPVVILTARGEEIDKIVGFEMGADDYITKPFSVRELVLRIKAVLNRLDRKNSPRRSIKFRDISIDRDRHGVTVGDRTIPLTLIEFNLLAYLIENEGRVLHRETLLNNVWGYSSEAESRTVDTHITRLREKLGRSAEHIRSIRGIGYSWK
jgi:two-component system phosphate regulon response regulator PhoB